MADQNAKSPATWDTEAFATHWHAHVDALAGTVCQGLSLKRVQYQTEQSPILREVRETWSGLSGKEREQAWKRLLEDSARAVAVPLPVCVKCGDCCRRSSPTLEIDDLEMIREEKIPWDMLYTLRRGEPARSPHTDQPYYLEQEHIKVREKPDSTECALLEAHGESCGIYPDRPLQCRAQTCWEAPDGERFLHAEHLTRRHFFGGVEPLVEVLDEHDRRCSFEKLRNGFEELKSSRGERIDSVIDVLAFDEHTREFCTAQLSVPPGILDLLLGRALDSRVRLFGFRVEKDANGSRNLLPE